MYSSIPVRTRSLGPSRGTSRGPKAPSSRNTFAKRTISSCSTSRTISATHSSRICRPRSPNRRFGSRFRPSPFRRRNLRQQRGEEADGRQERAELEHELNARRVRNLAEQRGADAAEAECEAKEQSRHGADAERHELLTVHHD